MRATRIPLVLQLRTTDSGEVLASSAGLRTLEKGLEIFLAREMELVEGTMNPVLAGARFANATRLRRILDLVRNPTDRDLWPPNSIWPHEEPEPAFTSEPSPESDPRGPA